MNAIPMFDWLGGYQKGWLRLDVAVGLTTGAVIVPKVVAIECSAMKIPQAALSSVLSSR